MLTGVINDNTDLREALHKQSPQDAASAIKKHLKYACVQSMTTHDAEEQRTNEVPLLPRSLKNRYQGRVS